MLVRGGSQRGNLHQMPMLLPSGKYTEAEQVSNLREQLA
jgi:hypothetical protein